MAKIETNEQGETIIRVDTKPVYCSIRVDMLNGNECEIEGWLLVDTSITEYFEIQPSVEYDPDGVTLAFPINQLLSISPAVPKNEITFHVGPPTGLGDLSIALDFPDRRQEVLNNNG